jgi:predicted GNAT family acetyltransferase
METLCERPGPVLERKCVEELDLYQREGRHWVLETGGEVVAYSAFNARLPDCVQVGGVWTPPAWRGRGFARAVVAGSLLEARVGGARRSILFTENDNEPAQAAYRALGYERVGDYGLVLFAQPQVVAGEEE